MAKRTTRFHDLELGELLKIGDVVVELQQKSGRKARLKLTVPQDERVRVEKPGR